MVQFICCLPLLLRLALPGMVMKGVGSGVWMMTVQHFYSSILDAWQLLNSASWLRGRGFGELSLLFLKGSSQLLNSSHLRERDKMLLSAILCGGVWNGFLLGQAKKQDVPCRFCGKRDGDGHRGSAMELVDGTLKLRHCTPFFTKRFSQWILPWFGRGSGIGKRSIVTSFDLLDCRGNFGKRVRLT